MTLIPECGNPPPEELLRGVEQFNRQEFYECHETLEALWLSEPGEVRSLYQGVLQVGVGFYHLLRGNQKGGMTLLDRGIRRLEPFVPACRGVQVAQLIDDVRRFRGSMALA